MTHLILFAALLTGCTDNSPEAMDAREWAGQLDPLLHENALLAEQILESAAEIYNGQGDPAKLERKWTEAIVPTAKHLRDQAELVKPPAAWEAKHQTLVETWTDRADAFEEIMIGLETGNKESWSIGRKRSDEAKLREEKWFQVVNQELAAYDIVLDQFP